MNFCSNLCSKFCSDFFAFSWKSLQKAKKTRRKSKDFQEKVPIAGVPVWWQPITKFSTMCVCAYRCIAAVQFVWKNGGRCELARSRAIARFHWTCDTSSYGRKIQWNLANVLIPNTRKERRRKRQKPDSTIAYRVSFHRSDKQAVHSSSFYAFHSGFVGNWQIQFSKNRYKWILSFLTES